MLLDEAGNEVGQAEKYSTHHSQTPLHKAFSCYLFDSKGRLLITKRAATKKVWPGFWTNTACGHPGSGETDESAIVRRLHYELGMTANNLRCVKKDYRYKTPEFNGIIEHELCPIYIGSPLNDPIPNPDEVQEFVWLEWSEYVRRISTDSSNEFSWWCKDQLKHITEPVESFLADLKTS